MPENLLLDAGWGLGYVGRVFRFAFLSISRFLQQYFATFFSSFVLLHYVLINHLNGIQVSGTHWRLGIL